LLGNRPRAIPSREKAQALKPTAARVFTDARGAAIGTNDAWHSQTDSELRCIKSSARRSREDASVTESTDRDNAEKAYALPWRGSAAVMATGIVLAAAVESQWLRGAARPMATWSMHWSVAASWMLALAAALYLVAQASWPAYVGRWASRLALWGAGGLLAASALRALESAWLLPAQPFAEQFEAPSWIAAVAVLVYLRIEQAWSNRDGGALVLLLVLAALWMDLWLMAWTAGLPNTLAGVVRGHLGWLWHAGGKVGVAACVFLGAWCAAGMVPAWQRFVRDDTRLRLAMCAGLAGFTVALLSALALLVLPGDHREAISRFLAGAAVWVNFGALYLVWRRWRLVESLFGWGIALALAMALLGYVGAAAMERLL
jgi:hypothetical protein